MLFLCRKYVILKRPSWKLPSALSKNCVSIFIYFCINICFCIKQANKICTLLSSHLLALIVFSVQCFCFMKAYIFFLSSLQTLNPAGEGLASVNFSITKLSDAQRARLNLWWKEVYQHVSPEANVSHFPFIFLNLSGFSSLLVTTCLLRLFTQGCYHGTTMIDNTKTISCTVRATYYARTDFFRRTNVWEPVSQRASAGMTSGWSLKWC